MIISDNQLLHRIQNWDGVDAKERDTIRALLYCRREGFKFDSIVGEIEGDTDRRIVLFIDNTEGMGISGGTSIDMAALDVWPACAFVPRTWWEENRQTVFAVSSFLGWVVVGYLLVVAR